MNEKEIKPPLWKKACYWIFSVCLILFLMILLFGGGQIIWEYKVGFFRAWGLLFVVIGLLILYFHSFKNPYSFYGRWLRRRDRGFEESSEVAPKQTTRIKPSVLYEDVLGTALIVGGITYSITKDIMYVIVALLLSSWMIRLKKYRTED